MRSNLRCENNYDRLRMVKEFLKFTWRVYSRRRLVEGREPSPIEGREPSPIEGREPSPIEGREPSPIERHDPGLKRPCMLRTYPGREPGELYMHDLNYGIYSALKDARACE